MFGSRSKTQLVRGPTSWRMALAAVERGVVPMLTNAGRPVVPQPLVGMRVGSRSKKFGRLASHCWPGQALPLSDLKGLC